LAITNLDAALAGAHPPQIFLKVGVTMEAIGVLYSPFYATGLPGAATVPSPGIGGAALTTYAGQIPFTNPGSGNSSLSRLSVASTLAGTLLLCDRLWHNSGIAVATTTAQTVNSAAWPARDRNGATSGDGVLIGIEFSTTGTAGVITNTTMSYSNTTPNSGRTATIASVPATPLAGTFIPFQLAAGDTGVSSIQTVTLGTAYTTAVIHLVAYRILAQIGISVANVASSVDALTGGFTRLYDNTVPFLLWLPSATTAVTLTGSMTVTQG
jgi:hypothetical protein